MMRPVLNDPVNVSNDFVLDSNKTSARYGARAYKSAQAGTPLQDREGVDVYYYETTI